MALSNNSILAIITVAMMLMLMSLHEKRLNYSAFNA